MFHQILQNFKVESTSRNYHQKYLFCGNAVRNYLKYIHNHSLLFPEGRYRYRYILGSYIPKRLIQYWHWVFIGNAYNSKCPNSEPVCGRSAVDNVPHAYHTGRCHQHLLGHWFHIWIGKLIVIKITLFNQMLSGTNLPTQGFCSNNTCHIFFFFNTTDSLW